MGKLRNTSPEIAEAIFEVANYDEKLAEQIWEEGNDEVLVRAFKTDKDSLFWGEQTIERKTSERSPPTRVIFYFAALSITALNLSTGRSRCHPPDSPSAPASRAAQGIAATVRWRYAADLNSGKHTQFSSARLVFYHASAGRQFYRQSGFFPAGRAADKA